MSFECDLDPSLSPPNIPGDCPHFVTERHLRFLQATGGDMLRACFNVELLKAIFAVLSKSRWFPTLFSTTRFHSKPTPHFGRGGLFARLPALRGKIRGTLHHSAATAVESRSSERGCFLSRQAPSPGRIGYHHCLHKTTERHSSPTPRLLAEVLARWRRAVQGIPQIYTDSEKRFSNDLVEYHPHLQMIRYPTDSA